MVNKVIEWWHFYSKIWFTTDAKKWWQITEELCNLEPSAQSMLFIDDVHEKNFVENPTVIPVHINLEYLIWVVSKKCKQLIPEINETSATLGKTPFSLSPNYIVLESEMKEYTDEIIRILSNLPWKKRAKFKEWVWNFCSNIKLTDGEGEPTCVWFDVWLTLLKQRMWFSSGVNVLPSQYKEQQEKVRKIIEKIIPEFDLKMVSSDEFISPKQVRKIHTIHQWKEIIFPNTGYAEAY
jgi:hypothetical protein